MKPAKIMNDPPSMMASICTCTSTMTMRRIRVAMTRAKMTAAKMPRPPALGRGSLFKRRAFGSSAQPTRSEYMRMRGMNHQAASAAIKKVRTTVTQPRRPGA